MTITNTPSGPPLPGDGKSRIQSTLVQLFLAGAFTKLIDAIGADIPTDLQAYWMGATALALSYAMAYADAHGIEYPGKKALGRGASE